MTNETVLLGRRPNPFVAALQRPLVQAFFSDPITFISATFVLVVVLAAIFAPIVAPHDQKEQQLSLRHLPPFSTGTAVID
jgi:ABC-type antimicrobial peptide transport system permease subunit